MHGVSQSKSKRCHLKAWCHSVIPPLPSCGHFKETPLISLTIRMRLIETNFTFCARLFLLETTAMMEMAWENSAGLNFQTIQRRLYWKNNNDGGEDYDDGYSDNNNGKWCQITPPHLEWVIIPLGCSRSWCLLMYSNFVIILNVNDSRNKSIPLEYD